MAPPDDTVPASAEIVRLAEQALGDLAVVAIGRNEGERLERCLRSVVDTAAVTVYVDSGSTDDSLDIARRCGAEIVELDTSIPFSAARARNAGYRAALAVRPDLRWIQFVDGDCEVQSGWLHAARRFLAENPKVAAVCGRRRERFPERSIYNELCDIEWDVSPGVAKYCGGDVMIRGEALVQVDGYRDSLIAGEEPELCVRLRRAGWQIYVLDRDMTLHDAAMTRFPQWWRRVKRSGWAYAAGAHLHGRSPERHWVWQSAQAWIWVALPLAALLAALPLAGWWAFAILLIYPLQFLRLFMKLTGTPRRRWLSAYAFTVGRFAEFAGQLRYLWDVATGRSARLIEYK
jgi:GT2 family glycosyltransferase